jgi:Rod binding domain-containing protein
MNIEALQTLQQQVRLSGRTESRVEMDSQRQMLRDACNQFESMLMGILLKEGFGSSLASEGGGRPQALMQETAIEQVANQMTEEGGIGLATALYEQLSASLADGLPSVDGALKGTKS